MAEIKKILIVGAGLTGCILAYRAHKKGYDVTVIDKRSHIGGNIYTENINGICVHSYGAHIFHTSDEKVWNFVNKFVHFNNYIHTVKTKLEGKVYSLPINMNLFNEVFGIIKPSEIKKEHIEKIRDLFFKGYTAKQWNLTEEELPEGLFDRIPVRETYDNRYFNDTYQGIPKEGYTYLVEQLLKGCKVLLNTDYKCLENPTKEYDKIFYCGMIDEFMDFELGHLEYRSLRFDTQFLNIKNYQGCSVMNEASIDIPYTRTIEHKFFNLDDDSQEGTIITKEYPQKYDGTNEAYYTINNQKNNTLHDRYLKVAKKKFPNIKFCGRLGEYKYYDMDDAIAKAMKIKL